MREGDGIMGRKGSDLLKERHYDSDLNFEHLNQFIKHKLSDIANKKKPELRKNGVIVRDTFTVEDTIIPHMNQEPESQQSSF
jgi:hypothetical protein